MRIYIAGPMSGHLDHNFPAFHEAANQLRNAGYEVVSPAEKQSPEECRTWREWMRIDIPLLLQCDGVATLFGWELSRGARLEVSIARGLELPEASVNAWVNHSQEKAIAPSVDPLSLDYLAYDVTRWQDETFPQSTPLSRATHLHKEAAELLASPTDELEMADVFILLCGLAKVTGVDLVEAVNRKMAINRSRTWGKPDEIGVVEHVRDGALSEVPSAN